MLPGTRMLSGQALALVRHTCLLHHALAVEISLERQIWPVRDNAAACTGRERKKSLSLLRTGELILKGSSVQGCGGKALPCHPYCL